MTAEDYDLRLVKTPSVSPDFIIDDDQKTITYVYDGDPAELVVLAQRAGEMIAKRRQIPLLPSVE